MTRKDFELIAKTIKTQHGAPWHEGTAKAFADALEKHSGNSSFDKARFLKACGVAVQPDA